VFPTHRLRRAWLPALLVGGAFHPASAQIGGVGGIIGRAAGRLNIDAVVNGVVASAAALARRLAPRTGSTLTAPDGLP